MITKEAAGNELASLMKMNMRPKLPTQQEKMAAVLEHLNMAAEHFDEAGNDKFAGLVTDYLVRFANPVVKFVKDE